VGDADGPYQFAALGRGEKTRVTTWQALVKQWASKPGDRVRACAEKNGRNGSRDLEIMSARGCDNRCGSYVTNTDNDHSHVLGKAGAACGDRLDRGDGGRVWPAAAQTQASNSRSRWSGRDFAAPFPRAWLEETIEAGAARIDAIADRRPPLTRRSTPCISYTWDRRAPTGVLLAIRNIRHVAAGRLRLWGVLGAWRRGFCRSCLLSILEHTAGMMFPI